MKESKTQRDYHVEINVMAAITEDDQRQEMMQAWGEALEALGIPFIVHLARCQTFHGGKPHEYQQLLYGISGTVQPSADIIKEGVAESLANHGWPDVPVGLDIFVVDRSLVDSTKTDQPQQFQKGVLAA